MTDPKKPNAADLEASHPGHVIPEVQLDKVTGGLVPRKAGETPPDYRTSTGAGVGKV